MPHSEPARFRWHVLASRCIVTGAHDLARAMLARIDRLEAEAMDFYDREYLAKVCAHVFGGAWDALTAEQRRVVCDDVEAIDAEESEQGAPRRAAETLRQRIGGIFSVGGYADCLLAGERRRAEVRPGGDA